ncbi:MULTISPECIES: hypothetical protein [unclassified Endozoicomonas]|uniref:hypothetical protein n=1 Tax=unclassified Endozoicomonas TaxID=2644528 RepID=UPI003BB6A83C
MERSKRWVTAPDQSATQVINAATGNDLDTGFSQFIITPAQVVFSSFLSSSKLN